MPSIGPYYSRPYTPPAPPSEPPPVPTNPDGTPKTPEVIVVIAPRQSSDPYRPLLPYGGLSGAQESARRDMQWATSHPWERVEAMGMKSQDFTEVGRDDGGYAALGLSDDASLIEAAYQWSPSLDVAALIRDGVEETLSQSIDNQRTGKIGGEAARMHFDTRGLTLVGEQVRMIVNDEDGNPRVRIYDFLVRASNGDLRFIEVKTNGATRNGRQTMADRGMESSGGFLATSNPRLSLLPRNFPPTDVEVWNIILPPRGT